MGLIDVGDVAITYKTIRGDIRAVDGVTFSIEPGESFGLAGESGCGKTTIALAILQLLPYNGEITRGSILYKGDNLVKKTRAELKKIRWKDIAIIFQGAMNALNPLLSIGDQITEVVTEHETISEREIRQRTEDVLNLVGLEASRVINNYPHELSGGMKQRVMIAMALACNPKMVIADEPTTALDVVIQGQILTLIAELQKRLNLSVMLISHDLFSIGELCDKVGIMYAGNLVEVSPSNELFEHPIHPYTQALLDSLPTLKGPRKEIVPITGAPPNLLNPPSGCKFHPRCSKAFEKCPLAKPEMLEVEPNRYIACHLYA